MWQLWIENDNQEFEKVGLPKSDVDANLWLQVLGKHFGCEVRLRLVAKVVMPVITPHSQWPGEG